MMQATGSASISAMPRVDIRPLLRNVYLWMSAGLLTTAVSASAVTSFFGARIFLFSPWFYIILFVVQLILVGVLAGAIQRLSTGAAVALFLAYAGVTGITLSLIFTYYTGETLVAAFMSTVVIFLLMTFVAVFTKTDLTKYGTYLFVGLIGLLIAMLVNIFLRSSLFDLVMSLFAVLLFSVLTAYDTQKIVRLASDPKIQGDGSALMQKLSILGALTLYLDFLNLFLWLLRIFGRRD
jgi:FtsH-binding integral membrane protein